MSTVTIVPSDKLIIVDDEALVFDFPAPENMHALQWDGQRGHIEWTDDINWPLEAEAYEEEVAPYVALWQAEKARREKAAAEAEAARLAEYNSEPARFARLREERDRRIAATDYLIMPDYPLAEDSRTAVQIYRQALRDLPTKEGAPWDGGGEATPWPAMPDVLTRKSEATL